MKRPTLVEEIKWKVTLLSLEKMHLAQQLSDAMQQNESWAQTEYKIWY